MPTLNGFSPSDTPPSMELVQPIDSGVHVGDSDVAQICVCAGCGEKILDRYYLAAVDKQWHADCLRCCDCNTPLETQCSCFTRDNLIYCRDDYYRKYAVKQCASCFNTITANELVMRAKDFIYHMDCFSCATCGIQLKPGDRFGMHDRQIYCQNHYDPVSAKANSMLSWNMPDLSCTAEMSIPSYFGTSPISPNSLPNTQKGRPRKRKGANSLEQGSPTDNLCTSNTLGYFTELTGGSPPPLPGADGLFHAAQRQKRMRTSFKHQQLKIMKMYFQCNHNPDAKDLKNLAMKTGLTKRVLQVWFQNARAKYRRQQSKNPGAADGLNSDGLNISGGSIGGGDSDTCDDLLLNNTDPTSATATDSLSDMSSAESLTEIQSGTSSDLNNTIAATFHGHSFDSESFQKNSVLVYSADGQT